MEIMNNFYVYIHQRKTDGVIFYVGKGCDNRAWSIDGRNRAWTNMAVEHGRDVVIVAEGMTHDEALATERSQIRVHTLFGCPLTNIRLMVTQRIVREQTAKRGKKKLLSGKKTSGFVHKGELHWTWKRTPKRNDWRIATIKTMMRDFGGSRKEWESVTDGLTDVGPKGWRLHLKGWKP